MIVVADSGPLHYLILLDVTGSLGILRTAAERDLIQVPEILGRLRETSFYVDEKLILSVFGEWLEPS